MKSTSDARRSTPRTLVLITIEIEPFDRNQLFMTREVVLLAAKNHSMFIVDICRDAGVPVHGFLDDTLPIGHKVMDRPVLGGFSMMEDASFRDNFDFFVAMGTPKDHWLMQTLTSVSRSGIWFLFNSMQTATEVSAH